jgi:pimeloyl-ACP methyl ester carboxylesterase
MIRVGADEIWTEDRGGDGPPVVLLHEGVGDSRIWAPVLPLLDGYRVLRYDCRGFGRTPASSEPYTLLGDFVAVLDHFGLERVTPVGCSMGGGMAAGLAIADPGRVDGLVLGVPGIPGWSPPPHPDMAAAEAVYEESGDLEPAIEASLRVWAASGADETVTTLMRDASRAWVSEGEHQQPDEPVFDRLAEIRTPTVLLAGDLDRPELVAANLDAARRIPGCRLVRLPGVDHYPTLRAPQAIADALHTVRPI